MRASVHVCAPRPGSCPRRGQPRSGAMQQRGQPGLVPSLPVGFAAANPPPPRAQAQALPSPEAAAETLGVGGLSPLTGCFPRGPSASRSLWGPAMWPSPTRWGTASHPGGLGGSQQGPARGCSKASAPTSGGRCLDPQCSGPCSALGTSRTRWRLSREAALRATLTGPQQGCGGRRLAQGPRHRGGRMRTPHWVAAEPSNFSPAPQPLELEMTFDLIIPLCMSNSQQPVRGPLLGCLR